MFCSTRRSSHLPVDQVSDAHLTAARVAGVHRHDGDARHRSTTVDAGQLLDTVHLLESAAIALGSSRLTPQQLTGAHEINAALRVCRLTAAARLARGFHQTLLCACSNRRMLEVLRDEVATMSSWSASFVFDDAEIDRVTADHATILELITTGAPTAELERALRAHATRSPLCSVGY